MVPDCASLDINRICHEHLLQADLELLAHEHVGFFALLRSDHGLLLGYTWFKLAKAVSIVSTRRQDCSYAPVIRSQNHCANTSPKKSTYDWSLSAGLTATP